MCVHYLLRKEKIRNNCILYINYKLPSLVMYQLNKIRIE